MKLRILALLAVLLSPLAVAAQSAVLGKCWYAAGSAWVPMAASINGAGQANAPAGFALYGLNSGAYYPIACDAGGHLVVTIPVSAQPSTCPIGNLYQITPGHLGAGVIYGNSGTGTTCAVVSTPSTSGIVSAGTAGQIGYYPANGSTIAGLADSTFGVLTNDGLGDVPTFQPPFCPDVSQPPYNVKCDFSGTDTTQIQNAINNNSCISFPQGNGGTTRCLYSGTLAIPDGKHLTIHGNGSFLVQTDADATTGMTIGTGAVVAIDDLIFFYNGTATQIAIDHDSNVSFSLLSLKAPHTVGTDVTISYDGVTLFNGGSAALTSATGTPTFISVDGGSGGLPNGNVPSVYLNNFGCCSGPAGTTFINAVEASQLFLRNVTSDADLYATASTISVYDSWLFSGASIVLDSMVTVNFDGLWDTGVGTAKAIEISNGSTPDSQPSGTTYSFHGCSFWDVDTGGYVVYADSDTIGSIVGDFSWQKVSTGNAIGAAGTLPGYTLSLFEQTAGTSSNVTNNTWTTY